MFFEAKDGRAFPVSRIAAIQPPRDGARLVRLVDGEAVEVSAGQIEALNHGVVSAFAALADTYVVTLEDEAAGGRIWKSAVVGWCVAADGRSHPVTADGVHGGDEVCVLTPDGRVTQAGRGLWKSLDDWSTSLRRERQAA